MIHNQIEKLTEFVYTECYAVVDGG